MDRDRVERLIGDLLQELGAPAASAGLLQTPARVATSLESLTAGYQGTVHRPVGSATLAMMPNGLTLARNLEFFSVCEHHLLPFFGRCHVGWVGAGRALGLDELGRVVETHARRLQLQERLTEQLAEELWKGLRPRGLLVAMEARHLCMMMRGVAKQASTVSTTSARGVLRDPAPGRSEFFALVGSGRPGGEP